MASGVTHLHISNYRSYDVLDLSTSTAPVVLFGDNGAGKTNIMEAISLFAPGKGLRRAPVSDIQSLQTQSPWLVRMEMDYDVTLAMGLDPSLGQDKRIFKAQSEVVKSQSALSEWVNILWFTPETDRLFLDSPQTRRRFIDRFVYVVDPSHMRRISRYEQSLRQRMQVLKNGGGALWLDALEKTIAEEGVAILIARQNVLDALSQQSKTCDTSLIPPFDAHMTGDLYVAQTPALVIENNFKEKLSENRYRDRESGMTHVGPHRSDFAMVHLVKNKPATHCSTGEQKILLLSLILSFIDRYVLESTKLTLFLMDDIIAHLDFQHRVLLFERLNTMVSTLDHAPKFQAWMTGTDRDFFEPLKDRAQFFHVDNGSVNLV